MKANDIILDNDKILAKQNDEYIVIQYKIPYTLKIALDNQQDIDSEIIRMLKMKTQDEKKIFLQKDVGEIMNLSRQMINRRWKLYKNDGLMAVLKGNYHRRTITPEVLSRLEELYVENPFLKSKEVKKILEDESLCDYISHTATLFAKNHLNSNRMIWLMRKKAERNIPEAFFSSAYLIERLFDIIDSLLSKTIDKVCSLIMNEVYFLKNIFLRATKKGNSPTQNDKYQKRKKLARDKNRNIGVISRLLNGLFSKQLCPDCHSYDVKRIFKRKRMYKNKKGEIINSYSTVYKCESVGCSTDYFTIPPKGVELYARVHKNVKRTVFRWIFHLRASTMRVSEELKENGFDIASTTIIRWIKKAGEECVSTYDLNCPEDWQQSICIDEKWVKVRSRWCYVFIAVGQKAQDMLYSDIYWHKDMIAMKSFLLKLKALGFRPQCITTDLLLGYEKVVQEVFPKTHYHQCILHAERDAKRIIRIALSDNSNKEIKDILYKKIRLLFKSKTQKQAKKRMARIMKMKEKAPESISSFFKMLVKYYPKFYNSLSIKGIPMTTNLVERMIGEFDEKYQGTKGFTSFHCARFFLKVYEVYYRLKKISYGRFRGFSRLRLKNSPLSVFEFTDYLTPTYH